MVKSNIFVLLSVLALAVACGGAAKPEKFVFTPVPYTVVPLPLPSTPLAIAISPAGGKYIVNEVIAGVTIDRVPGFERWARTVGFTAEPIGPPAPTASFVSVLVKVPLGAAPDAVELVKKQDGVQFAELNFVRGLQSETQRSAS